ncbi:cell division protein FtsZ, partial [bacterium]|nr:cell division protein FtsZ [candidate division CSSED10-310 bacterium]
MYSYIEEVAKNQANIKVIGIGGGGCNAVERMLTKQMSGVEFIACNTDMQSLQQYHAPTCIQLGSGLTRGLGAGGNPKVGRAAALEDEEKVRTHLTGADMVFITAGMGGGTGTGGAPIVAQIARELGILTIAVVTLPFRFEGRRRRKIADTGIRDLEEYVDTLIVIPNEKLLSAVEPDTSVRNAFMKADEILSNAVQGISDLITEPGEVNVDFADVRTIMTDMGKALLGTGIGIGENRAGDAVEAAISSPLLEDLSINGARGVLINITSGDDLGMIEFNAACNRIEQAADEDALIIFGHVIHPEWAGRMKITVIATGFEEPRVRDYQDPPTRISRAQEPTSRRDPLRDPVPHMQMASAPSQRETSTGPGDR